MNESDISIDFSGGFFVPGKSGARLEADHMERYMFACKYAKDKSILDIASGVGYSAPLFIKAGAVSYVGVDLNEKLVKYANERFGSANKKYYLGDICSFNKGETYDIITCFETIEHVENYEAAIKNLFQLLNKGGLLIISSPNRPITSPKCSSLDDKPENKHHVQEFIPEELLSLLKQNHFTVGKDDLYGQRQRRVRKCRYMQIVDRLIKGDPNVKTSAEVSPVKDKTPRYFIITASKV